MFRYLHLNNVPISYLKLNNIYYLPISVAEIGTNVPLNLQNSSFSQVPASGVPKYNSTLINLLRLPAEVPPYSNSSTKFDTAGLCCRYSSTSSSSSTRYPTKYPVPVLYTTATHAHVHVLNFHRRAGRRARPMARRWTCTSSHTSDTHMSFQQANPRRP